jgi:hypothetical protein
MADFRKWILALVVLTLFAGLASAQSTPFECQAQAAVTPGLRSEGLTELVGDILITCSGGAALPSGAAIPTANITVFMNGTVTSRLLGTGGISNASEALLLVNDPRSASPSEIPTPQYGNELPQILCTTPGAGAGANGCTQVVGTIGPNAGVPVANTGNQCTSSGGSGCSAQPAGTAGANVFQGMVNSGSVTFLGVPVIPPVTSSATLTYRITNIRVNANGITGGGPIPANAVAALSITGSTSIPITNAQVTVGFISQSLSTAANKAYSTSSGPTNFAQCQSQPGSGSTPVAAATLRFAELQGSAFKMRGPVVSSASPSTPAQNIPGLITSDESGFVAPYLTSTSSASGSSITAGLADWGTRLKAVFNNIPSGVNLFVSVNNLNGGANGPAGAPPAVGSSFASLIVSETSPDTGFNPPGLVSGTPPAITPIAGTNTGMPLITQTGTVTNVNGLTGSVIGYAPLTIINGSASAVWEVVNSVPNQLENFDFEVYITYSANVASNIPTPAPAPGMTVNLSYAPTPPSGSLTSWSQASATLGIPRFADTSTAKSVLTISICQTALLYPYVINTNGFDTGLAVANTTQDPFGTAAQTGYCSIYWYGSTPPSTNPGFLGSAGYQTTTPTSSQLIAAGTIQAWGTSVVAPGFSGYVIAVCNFQFAHGFAFVSDLGARNLAMGYLADVLNSPIPNLTRGSTPITSEANGQ